MEGGHIVSLGYEPHRYTIFYFRVNDSKATLAKAAENGGRTLVPPVQVPESKAMFAWMADPEGNTIGLYWEPKK
jgi:predicted enzyme related to lactoylglutathione lyase